MSLVSELKDQYNRLGYFKIEGFFEKKFVNEIQNEIDLLKTQVNGKITIYNNILFKHF